MTGKRLLIVEDDRSLRHILTWEFQDMGYLVSASDCCTEALGLVQTLKFDFALLDYNLPDGVGLDLLAMIRRKNPKIPVILCSGRVSESNLKETLLSANVSFASKPVTAGSLNKQFKSLITGTE